MLKHILTGQPSSTGSRHHNDYQTSSGSLHGPLGGGLHHTHHHHQESSSSHHPYNNATIRGTGGRTGSADVYDSVVHPSQKTTGTTTTSGTQSSNHPLNHSQLSVNNLSAIQHRLNHSTALSLSMLSTSKHSVNSVSPVVGNNHNLMTTAHVPTLHQDRPKINGGLDISRVSRLPSQTTPSPAPAVNSVILPTASSVHNNQNVPHQVPPPPLGPTVIPLNASWSTGSLSRNYRGHHEDAAAVAGVKEMLTSLGLLCLVSLLLALLSLIFLLKISPLTVTPSSLISPEEYTIVYEVTLALCALALSLNLCCLLVCAIQFLFAVKLVKTSYQGYRSNKYLQKSSISRVCAVGGFFISIPVFLTGMILYTFIQFHSTPAIVTSAFIGLGIVFCGCAMVHNVFVWQREKTNAVKALAREQCEAAAQLQRQQQQLQQQQQQHHQQHHISTSHNPAHHLHQFQQQQNRSNSHHQSTCVSKIPTSPNPVLANHGRGSQYQQHQQQQHHHHHHHSHPHPRHVSMSPPLLLSSPTTLVPNHNHHLNVSHRNVGTPPTTPGDRSPTSPSNNKLNRSQHHVPREASGSVSPGLPAATLDLSSAATTNSPHELSTLV